MPRLFNRKTAAILKQEITFEIKAADGLFFINNLKLI